MHLQAPHLLSMLEMSGDRKKEACDKLHGFEMQVGASGLKQIMQCGGDFPSAFTDAKSFCGSGNTVTKKPTGKFSGVRLHGEHAAIEVWSACVTRAVRRHWRPCVSSFSLVSYIPPLSISHTCTRLKSPASPFDAVSLSTCDDLCMLTWCVQFGPDGDTKIARVGEGKVQVHGSLNVEETLSVDDLIIDGVPLQKYIEKMIQAAMGR